MQVRCVIMPKTWRKLASYQMSPRTVKTIYSEMKSPIIHLINVGLNVNRPNIEKNGFTHYDLGHYSKSKAMYPYQDPPGLDQRYFFPLFKKKGETLTVLIQEYGQITDRTDNRAFFILKMPYSWCSLYLTD